jgi:hypothetical protein
VRMEGVLFGFPYTFADALPAYAETRQVTATVCGKGGARMVGLAPLSNQVGAGVGRPQTRLDTVPAGGR